MPGQAKQDEARHGNVSTGGDARDEEAVRRLARHFLATPPQPKKSPPKAKPKPKGRRRPQER